MSGLRLLLVDDDPLARRALRDALQDAGIVVVADAGCGRDAVELAAYYRPEVVLLDEAMPGMRGVEATRRILRAHPEARVVVLTAPEDDAAGLAALRAGAVGALGKDLALDVLPRAVEGVCRGEAAISRRMTGQVIARLREFPTDGVGLRPIRSCLTDREWEVLDLLCAGASPSGVANALDLAPETVRTHLKHIVRKLRVDDVDSAVQRARALRGEGLVPRG